MHNTADVFLIVIRAVILILIVSQICGRIFMFLHQPKVVGEMIAGVILGPTLLGNLFPATSQELFNADINSFLTVIGNFGISLYMFMMGMEIDQAAFKKGFVGRTLKLSLGTFIMPLLLGALVGWLFFPVLSGNSFTMFRLCLFIGISFSITAFPVLSRILDERNLVKTELGTMALLSASVQDVMCWVMLTFINVPAAYNSHLLSYFSLVACAVFAMVLFLLVKPLLARHIQARTRSGASDTEIFPMVLLLLCICAFVTECIGLHSAFGSFVFGLAMPRHEGIIQSIRTSISSLTNNLLIPVFFAVTGLKTNLITLIQIDFILPCIIMILLAFVGKYIMGLLVMRSLGITWRMASAMGALMNARGLMEIIMANIGLTRGYISVQCYSMLILLSIVSTLLAIPIYDWSLRQTNGMNIRPVPATDD